MGAAASRARAPARKVKWPDMDYARAIEYLLSLTDMERGYQASANPTMSLESVRSLLSRLNNPHMGRGTVHVTGSKGKGSTAHMIANVLRRAGLSTGLYTSPHLHSFTERIRIDGEQVSPGEFAMGLEAIRPAVEAERASMHGDASTFGVLTALFFWLVRAQAKPVRWQVVEVGLGGTYDATNALVETDVAVITPISLEHTAILGDTVEEIARDKAGIIKPGCICVVAPQKDPAVLDVAGRRCAEVGATLVDVGSEYEVVPLDRFPWGQSFQLGGPGSRTRELRTQLLGRHQLDNAATSVAVIDALRKRGQLVNDRAVDEGLARTRLHGRMEVMGQRPFVVADGAHNGESAAALVQALRDHADWKHLFTVLGVTSDKDVAGIVRELAPVTDRFVATRFRNARAMDTGRIAGEVAAHGGMADVAEGVPDAITRAMAANEEDAVVITGSLYVVAEAREHILGEIVVRG